MQQENFMEERVTINCETREIAGQESLRVSSIGGEFIEERTEERK